MASETFPPMLRHRGWWFSRWLAPAEDAQGSEGVPAAGLAYRFAGRNGERFIVGAVEQPSAIGLAFAFNHLHGFVDARVGLEIGGPKVVEGAENVVTIAGREGEFEECRIDDLAGGAAAEEAALEQVLVAAL